MKVVYGDRSIPGKPGHHVVITSISPLRWHYKPSSASAVEGGPRTMNRCKLSQPSQERGPKMTTVNEMQTYMAGMRHLGLNAADPAFLALLPDTGPRAAALAISTYAAALDAQYPDPSIVTKAAAEDEYYNGAALIWHTSEVKGLLRWLYCDPSIEADALAAGNDTIARWRGMFGMFHDTTMRVLVEIHPDEEGKPPILKPKLPTECV